MPCILHRRKVLHLRAVKREQEHDVRWELTPTRVEFFSESNNESLMKQGISGSLGVWGEEYPMLFFFSSIVVNILLHILRLFA